MSQPTDSDRLIATMALAMQSAQFALQNSPRDATLDLALSSLTIALNMEADHWQQNARRKQSQPSP